MVRLANQLAQDGDEVELVLLAKGGSNKAFVDPQVTLVELASKRTLQAFWPLRVHLSKRAPDAILAVLTHVNVLTALACWSLGWAAKLTVSERNTFSQDSKMNNSPVMAAAYFLAPWIYRCLPKPVIAVSRGVADDLIACTVVRDKDVITAPNPVINGETMLAASSAASHPWLRHKSSKVVVTAGRLSYQKGFDLLLQAFAAMPERGDSRLIIFGEGELRGELEAQITSLNLSHCVDLPGYSDNPLAEIKQADLYVLSSRFEGSPNALVEAMSVGTPVVAFDCPHGPREILRQDVNGINPSAEALVDYLDVKALSLAMNNKLHTTYSAQHKLDIATSVQGFQASLASAVYRKALLANPPQGQPLCK